MQRAENPAGSIAVAVCIDGREPYRMFEVVTLTEAKAELRGPLMLELGEQLSLRLTRDGRTIDVDGRITGVTRPADHSDPVTTVELTDAAGALLAPLLARPIAP